MATSQVGGVPARIFEQLDRAIALESVPLERDILLAKRACALARFSIISGARNQIMDLREGNKNYCPRLTAWIIFCEGLVHHFEQLDSHAAMDRFRRSYAIAVAIGDDELSNASRAWMANGLFMEGNSRAALENLDPIFGSERKVEPDTLARAFLVLADLISWSGQPLISKEWYRQARLQAVEFGDLAFQSLVMFNSASFHVADMTFQDCLGHELTKAEVRMLSLEVASVVNLNQGIGQPYLSFMVPLLHADMLILEERFTEALTLLDIALDNIDKIIPKRLIPKIVVQRAWANARLNMLAKAADDCRLAEENAENCIDIDDRAVLHARLASVYKICQDSVNSERNKQAFNRCLIAHGSAQSSLRAAVAKTIDAAVRYRTKNPA